MKESFFDNLIDGFAKPKIPPIEGYIFVCASGRFFVTTQKYPIGGKRVIFKIEDAVASQIKKDPNRIVKRTKKYSLRLGFLQSAFGKENVPSRPCIPK